MRSGLSLVLQHVWQQQNWGANASWAKTRRYCRWRNARSGCIVNARTPITSIDVPDADARPIGDGTLSLRLTKRTAPDAAAGWKIKRLHKCRVRFGAGTRAPGIVRHPLVRARRQLQRWIEHNATGRADLHPADNLPSFVPRGRASLNDARLGILAGLIIFAIWFAIRQYRLRLRQAGGRGSERWCRSS